MTTFSCAICGESDGRITIYKGTVICFKCLNEIRNNILPDSEKPLNNTVDQAVEYGMKDIYD